MNLDDLTDTSWTPLSCRALKIEENKNQKSQNIFSKNKYDKKVCLNWINES